MYSKPYVCLTLMSFCCWVQDLSTATAVVFEVKLSVSMAVCSDLQEFQKGGVFEIKTCHRNQDKNSSATRKCRRPRNGSAMCMQCSGHGMKCLGAAGRIEMGRGGAVRPAAQAPATGTRARFGCACALQRPIASAPAHGRPRSTSQARIWYTHMQTGLGCPRPCAALPWAWAMGVDVSCSAGVGMRMRSARGQSSLMVACFPSKCCGDNHVLFG